MTARVGTALLLFGLLGGCTQLEINGGPEQPPEGLPFATASDDCAPWDGHAVTLLLSDRPGSDTGGIDANHRPLVRVSFYPREAVAGGEQFRWPAEPDQASGLRCLGELPCESAVSGSISVSNALPDSIVSGAVVLHFADGSVTSGAFQARWIARRILCG